MFAAKNELFTSPSGYQISRSVRLRSSASAYFNRTFGTPTNNKIFTLSGWIKIGTIPSSREAIFVASNAGGTSFLGLEFNASAGITLWDSSYSAGVGALITTQVFRDPSSWYHIVFAVDTTQATASNRWKLYLNGSQITSFSSANYPSQNSTPYMNSAVAHSIGSWQPAAGLYFDGYLTEINFIDGQALTPTSFGQFNSVTGVWQPLKYTGTYGTNGFYLNFSDNSNNTATTIGKDYSGNGNNWTPNNISVTSGSTYDSMIDVPTPYADGGNGRGNYAVVNPLPPSTSGGSWFTQNGNLSLVRNGGGWITGVATIGVTSGKWYWEVIPQNAGNQFTIGIAKDGYDWTTYLGSNTSGWSYIGGTGDKYTNGVNTAYGATYTTNDVIGVAFDADAGTLTFYKNGTSQGQAFSGLTSGPYYPACGVSNLNTTAVFNFGQRPFTYTPPSGFVALNTNNLPAPTISNGALYMAATTYTGTSATNNLSNAVNGVSFKPDFVWMKNRTNALSHYLNDSVRGPYKTLFSNLTNAEYDGTSNSDGVSTFNSNGFTLLNGTNAANYNQSANNYVAWQWQAGQGTTSSNTSGSITSTVSVNATAGFSVVAYNSGASGDKTVGHGLGVAPSMIITKSRSSASYNWSIYHASVATTVKKYLTFTTDALQDNGSNIWGSAFPTSSVFGITSGNGVVASTDCIAYCFSAVRGYSAFGSYTGNGSTDGPFVYLGFRPRFVMVKRSDSTGGWVILDSSRDTYNVASAELAANSSAAEVSPYSQKDFLSNGFKLRNTQSDNNASGGTYVYAAFAENPFKNSLAR